MAVKFRARVGDVLADVLGTVGLTSRVFCASEFSAPWAMTLGESDYAHFHVVEHGEAWFRFDTHHGGVRLGAGDLIVVPHGRGHMLGDSPTTEPVPLEDLPREQSSNHYLIRHGGGGVGTRMICGSFTFDRTKDNPLLAVLPPFLHVRASGERERAWLDPLLTMLAVEAREPRQGSGAIITRLTDVIFVQAVRAWLDEQPAGEGGWLGALRDPHVGKALAMMHREPERAWSVATLASGVGLSRSVFASRFKALVGQSPLAYLTSWRMHVVANLIENERLTLGDMAERVGYESEAAFSKAFKRHFAVSPRAYRQSRGERARTNPAAA